MGGPSCSIQSKNKKNCEKTIEHNLKNKKKIENLGNIPKMLIINLEEPSKTSGTHTPNLGNTPKTKNKNTQ